MFTVAQGGVRARRGHARLCADPRDVDSAVRHRGQSGGADHPLRLRDDRDAGLRAVPVTTAAACRAFGVVDPEAFREFRVSQADFNAVGEIASSPTRASRPTSPSARRARECRGRVHCRAVVVARHAGHMGHPCVAGDEHAQPRCQDDGSGNRDDERPEVAARRFGHETVTCRRFWPPRAAPWKSANGMLLSVPERIRPSHSVS